MSLQYYIKTLSVFYKFLVLVIELADSWLNLKTAWKLRIIFVQDDKKRVVLRKFTAIGAPPFGDFSINWGESQLTADATEQSVGA